MQPVIETEHLILRELLPEDEEGMFVMDSDPEVHKYIYQYPVTEMQQVRDVIAFIRKQYEDTGIGRWAVIEKSTGEFAGWSGLKLFNEPANGHQDFYEVGYRLAQKYWGKGYATESTIAALRYGFEVMNVPNVYAITHIDNRASRRVLTKAGLTYIEDFIFNNTPTTWFRITKEEWQTKRL